MCNNLKAYSAAAYAAVAIATPDEDRVISQIIREFPEAKNLWVISAVGGLRDVRTEAPVDDRAQYPQAFAKVSQSEDSILIVLDYQHLIKNAGAYRQLRQAFPALKSRGSMIILVAPSWTMPEELKHDIPVLESRLPSRGELQAALTLCAESVGVTIADPAPILDSASGLTLAEAENSFALAYAENKSFDPVRILDEKLKLVRQSGQLEIALPAAPEELGGLDALREYIKEEVIPSMRSDSLRVRGLLLCGVPGTGKSLAARVAGSLLGWPVLRMDMGSLKGSLVGQSEQNMRAALKLAEAVAPCCLLMDEIEKSVGGHASSAQSDGGTTLGMIGILLSWMQEHNSPILCFATCNDYSKLPTELTRAGRFDERFFVDLPSINERIEIAAIHFEKFCGPVCQRRCEAIAEMTEGFSGAEIEQLVKSAARRYQKDPTTEQFQLVCKDIKPISKVRSEEIQKLRDWGKAQLRIANTPEIITAGPARKVRTA